MIFLKNLNHSLLVARPHTILVHEPKGIVDDYTALQEFSPLGVPFLKRPVCG